MAEKQIELQDFQDGRLGLLIGNIEMGKGRKDNGQRNSLEQKEFDLTVKDLIGDVTHSQLGKFAPVIKGRKMK